MHLSNPALTGMKILTVSIRLTSIADKSKQKLYLDYFSNMKSSSRCYLLHQRSNITLVRQMYIVFSKNQVTKDFVTQACPVGTQDSNMA